MGHIWDAAADIPEAIKAAIQPSANEPRWKWDDAPQSGNCALRAEDGRVVLVVIQQGEHTWGIWQPYYDWRNRADFELIQIRGTRSEARECAVEMAGRTGWIR